MSTKHGVAVVEFAKGTARDPHDVWAMVVMPIDALRATAAHGSLGTRSRDGLFSRLQKMFPNREVKGFDWDPSKDEVRYKQMFARSNPAPSCCAAGLCTKKALAGGRCGDHGRCRTCGAFKLGGVCPVRKSLGDREHARAKPRGNPEREFPLEVVVEETVDERGATRYEACVYTTDRAGAEEEARHPRVRGGPHGGTMTYSGPYYQLVVVNRDGHKTGLASVYNERESLFKLLTSTPQYARLLKPPYGAKEIRLEPAIKRLKLQTMTWDKLQSELARRNPGDEPKWKILKCRETGKWLLTMLTRHGRVSMNGYNTKALAERAMRLQGRENPGIANWTGGPEHTWVYPGGVRVSAGDTIEFHQYAGRGLKGPEYRPAKGKVHLIGPAGAVVTSAGDRRGANPTVVTDKVFIRLVRKARN